MKTFIYILICPVDGNVKYVGKSNNPEKRLKDHMLDFRCMDLEKAKWIIDLKRKKLKPKLEIIEQVDSFHWKEKESYWCDHYRNLGYTLFNKRSRNGLTFSNSKSFKKGNIPWNYGIKTSINKRRPPSI